jgi:pSer/pThr/pTyr-binding forkhead associated (FHA) protein
VPDSLLQILKVCLLAVLALFFLRVLRAVWAELKPPMAVAPPVAASPAAAAAGSRPATGLRLKVLEPAATRGQSYDLSDELTVGRAAGCGVALLDTTVSQLHARIFRGTDGRLWVEDLGSTNGTFVNRKKVSSAVPLRRGDRLQVGTTVLEVTR